MLVDQKNLARHIPGMFVLITVTLAAVGWYAWYARQHSPSEWPGGSSLPGLTLGVAGGLIILFEFLLWPRKWKRVRAWRIGRAQTWLRWHIWLGLLTVPLVLLHSGFRWGGQLSSVLALLFVVVIASGVFGLVMQNWLPRMLIDLVPGETIYSQMDHIAEQFATDAEDLVMVTCGVSRPADAAQSADETALEENDPSSFVVIGAVRSIGNVQGTVLEAKVPRVAVPNSGSLLESFESSIKQFLLKGGRSGSQLRKRERAAAYFDQLRLSVDPAAHAAVDALENWCDYRRQFDVQARIHRWLHAWLAIHLPLSIALLLLMLLHIVVAVKYW